MNKILKFFGNMILMLIIALLFWGLIGLGVVYLLNSRYPSLANKKKKEKPKSYAYYFNKLKQNQIKPLDAPPETIEEKTSFTPITGTKFRSSFQVLTTTESTKTAFVSFASPTSSAQITVAETTPKTGSAFTTLIANPKKQLATVDAKSISSGKSVKQEQTFGAKGKQTGFKSAAEEKKAVLSGKQTSALAVVWDMDKETFENFKKDLGFTHIKPTFGVVDWARRSGKLKQARMIKEKYAAELRVASNTWNVNDDLLAAMAAIESGGDPRIVHPKTKATGLVQLIPATARAMGVHDPTDPQQNLLGAARYLRILLNHFGNVENALLGYHFGQQGAENMMKAGYRAQVDETVQKVKYLYFHL